MERDLDQTSISSPSQLAELSARFIGHFCGQMAFPSAMEIQITTDAQNIDNRSSYLRPLHTILEPRKLTIYIDNKTLVGISPLALQGWLDMELARCQLALDPSAYRVNFNKNIRPLFNVSGSGLHVVRHMVTHLENSLKNLIAAQIVIEIGHSSPLLNYSYHKISPSIEDKDNYLRLLPHQWIRAIFLCEKTKAFMPVAVLADTGIALELESYWWNCHRYLATQDKQFLQTLFSLSKQNPVKYFSDTLVEMFKLVKSEFLDP